MGHAFSTYETVKQVTSNDVFLFCLKKIVVPDYFQVFGKLPSILDYITKPNELRDINISRKPTTSRQKAQSLVGKHQ